MNILQKTHSLCPQCLRTVKAYYTQRSTGIFLEKTCPAHGEFSVPVWIDSPNTPSFEQWCKPHSFVQTYPRNTFSSPAKALEKKTKGCPHDCGICQDHVQQSCCVLLEVTQRCTMQCPICYANAQGQKASVDPSLAYIQKNLQELMQCAGAVNIQLSGGEPTLREDLTDIIRLCHDEGFPFVQLNTNGLRMAKDQNYAHALKEAGLSLVYLQWDSMHDQAYATLRGGAYASIKEQALAHCLAAGLPVLLVITVVRGINDAELGAILQKALACGPLVRGIHMQPVASFGRYPWEQGAAPRLTIPELLHNLEKQSAGMLKASHFHPPHSEHALCSFSAVYERQAQDGLMPVHEAATCCLPQSMDAPLSSAVQARTFVAHHWGMQSAAPPTQTCVQTCVQDDFDLFLQKNSIKNRFTVSGMAFQDAYSVDLARLRRCHIHIKSGLGKLMPFCSYNLTSHAGFALHRGKEHAL